MYKIYLGHEGKVHTTDHATQRSPVQLQCDTQTPFLLLVLLCSMLRYILKQLHRLQDVGLVGVYNAAIQQHLVHDVVHLNAAHMPPSNNDVHSQTASERSPAAADDSTHFSWLHDRGT